MVSVKETKIQCLYFRTSGCWHVRLEVSKFGTRFSVYILGATLGLDGFCEVLGGGGCSCVYGIRMVSIAIPFLCMVSILLYDTQGYQFP